MPIEFIQQSQPTGSSGNSLFRLTMAYDATGRRISKTVMHKVAGAADWDTAHVTHYTGIGTEVRENFAGPIKETKVVVNMPNGLGRYGIEDAAAANANASKNFEWYLKNHLGSTMLVYGTVASTNPSEADVGETKAAYDYRSFGEMLELTPPATGKVTENFTGKEHDDEIALDYFGARYLDPMLGMWISVDSKRQFASPYLYVGNGYNSVNGVDPNGNKVHGTFNRSTYQVVLTDDNPARGSRTFYAVSGYHSQPLKRGGIIPVGKYEIFERVGEENYFSLLWEGPDGKYYDIFRPKEGDKVGKVKRGTFRFHRYHEGTNGCLSVVEKVDDDPDDDFHFKHIRMDDYNKLFEWIKGTETGSKNDSKGNERIDYGDIEVFGTPAPYGIETID